MTQQLLLLSGDLILSSQLEAPASAAGFAVAVASTVEAIPSTLATARPEVVVLDLADSAFPLGETLSLVRTATPGARMLAFYPHVRDELKTAAEAAGVDLVIPRSRFLTRPAEALRQVLDCGAER